MQEQQNIMQDQQNMMLQTMAGNRMDMGNPNQMGMGSRMSMGLMAYHEQQRQMEETHEQNMKTQQAALANMKAVCDRMSATRRTEELAAARRQEERAAALREEVALEERAATLRKARETREEALRKARETREEALRQARETREVGGKKRTMPSSQSTWVNHRAVSPLRASVCPCARPPFPRSSVRPAVRSSAP